MPAHPARGRKSGGELPQPGRRLRRRKVRPLPGTLPHERANRALRPARPDDSISIAPGVPSLSAARGLFGLALLLFCGVAARAFVADLNSNGDPLRWHLDAPASGGVHTNIVNPVTRAVRFYLAAEAYSATNTLAELNAVRASFAQWQSIPGTVLKFEEAGLIGPGADVNTSDNTNVIFWARNSTLVNGGLDDISGTLGATFNSFLPDNNAQAEADIVFNGVQYGWFTDFSAADRNRQFIESTAAHEIGHFLGLEHSPVGGATMLFRGAGGVNVQAGLSSDEVAATRWLYGPPGTQAGLGRLCGSVTMNGLPVFGAVVIAEETSSGNVIAGTVSRANGEYDLPSLPPGKYKLRVTPLDSPVPDSARFLIRGRDISSDQDELGNYIYDSAETGFLPTTHPEVALDAGATITRNLPVTSGAPAFRIARIGLTSPEGGSLASLPVSLHPGQSNYTVSVSSADLPTADATLTVTGDGLIAGPPTFISGGVNFILIPLSVAADATPGLRTLVVQRANDMAYANGFLEIQPIIPDFNFDGCDDRFQRRYFPLFTAPEAGPESDPDGDHFNNQAEDIAGTDPTNADSLLKIDRVVVNTQGSTLTWQSVPGKRYQVFDRLDLGDARWQAVGLPVTASGEATQFTDAMATNGFRFYRVQVLP